MRTPTGEIYLIDFGIARLFKAGQVQDTVSYGSVGYAAPEQFGKLTTPQSDIYSLGALLHQLLSGYDPGNNTPNPFTFPPLSRVPAELEVLVGQMVEMNAANRPTSMAAVYQELRRIEAQLIRKTPLPPTPSTPSGSHVYTYRGHTARVNTLAWSPDGTRIAWGSDDNTVQVYTAEGNHIYTYSGHTARVNALGWSPDGTRIASGSDDGTAQAWDAADGGHVFSYRGHFGYAVRALAWSPTTARIASGGADGTVQVWNVADGNLVYTFRGHTQYVDINTVAWSPDGTRIVSGSDDGTAQVWDAADGGHTYMYHGHSDYYLGHFITHATVNSVTWSPAGTRIASGSNDKTVQVWQDEG